MLISSLYIRKLSLATLKHIICYQVAVDNLPVERALWREFLGYLLLQNHLQQVCWRNFSTRIKEKEILLTSKIDEDIEWSISNELIECSWKLTTFFCKCKGVINFKAKPAASKLPVINCKLQGWQRILNFHKTIYNNDM